MTLDPGQLSVSGAVWFLNIRGRNEVKLEAQCLSRGVKDRRNLKFVSRVQRIDLWLWFARLLLQCSERCQRAPGLHGGIELRELLDTAENVFLLSNCQLGRRSWINASYTTVCR